MRADALSHVDMDAVVANYARIQRQFFPPRRNFVVLPPAPPVERIAPPPIIPICYDATARKREYIQPPRLEGASKKLRHIVETVCFWHSVVLDRAGIADHIADNQVSMEDIRSADRRAWLVGVRRDLCYEIVSRIRMSLTQMGAFINRDHTTVLWALRAKRSLLALGRE